MSFLYPVTQQIKSYFGKDGSPLNGTLRFGVANQDPEGTPVQVYWDVGGLQPAAQPIRVRNGYAIRGSTPANVFADGDFSAIARDSRSRLVYTVPNSADIQLALAVTGLGTAAAVGIADAGAYYTGTNVEAALQEVGASLVSGAAALVNRVPIGVVMDWVGLTEPAGWLFLSGRAIGSLASIGLSPPGTMARNNADTQALYSLLWNAYSNTELPIQDNTGTPLGGRGVSAANDFGADRRLPLPDCRGRVRAGRDDMGGTTASRLTSASGVVGTAMGEVGGTETHALTATQLTDHTHTATQGTHSHTHNAHNHGVTDTHTHPIAFAALRGDSTVQTVAAGVNNSYNRDTATTTNVTLTSSSGAISINNATTTESAVSSGAITVSAATASAVHQNTQPTIIFNAIIKY